MEPVDTTRRVSDGSGTTMLLFLVNEQVLGLLKPKRESEVRFIRRIMMTQSFLAY